MMKRIFNDHDARPWWFVLIALLAALVLVQQAGAAMYWNFDNLAAGDQVVSGLQQQGDGEVTVANDPFYNELGCAVRTGVGAYPFTGSLKTTTSFPTDYWSFVHVKGVVQLSNIWFVLWDSEGGYIDSFRVYTAGPMSKMEIKKEGNDYYSRVNGGSWTNKDTIATTPYYYSIEGANSQQQLVDDIIIGTTGTNNIIVTIPDSWFVAKDIFNPSYTGIYDVVDHIAYEHDLHVKYVSDEVDRTIKIECIESGAIVNTTTTTTMCGYITYNVTTMLFNTDAPYGFYKIYFSDDPTIYDTFNYRAISTSGTSVQWDNSIYTDGDEATITFAISESNWDTDDYSYELRILDSDLSEIYSKSIASRPVNATQDIDITTALFPITGTYYATLYATDLSSSEDILLVYDDAYMYCAGSGAVTVSGETYYAVNNSVVGGADVNITQLGVTHETTSNVTDGTYEVVDLITDWSIGCNASLTGYESYEVFFTPLAGGEYNVDLLLVPTGGPQPGNWYDVTGGQMTADSSGSDTTDYWNATLNGTSVGGIVYEAPYWNPASGALVNISNSTWSDTALIGAGGWYQFDNLTQSQYSLSISKTGFATCSGTVTPLENQFTRKDAYLEIEYTLTVNAKDLASLGLITGDTVTISLSTGQSDTTTTGSVTFTGLSYNVYDVVASCEGYYAGYSTIILNEDMTVDVYLQSMGDSSSGPSANYIPHPVRFTYVDATGNPITGATVTAIAQESSNPWSWLSSVFGFNTNLTNINTTLSGTTGHDGTLSLLMVETVQYEVHCVKASAGIDHTVDIYPKNTEYFIRIGSLPMVGSYPTYSLNATTVGTNVVLFGNYTDTSGSSSGVRFIVRNSTGSEVYNTSVSLTGGVGSAYYAVNNTRGDQFTFGITGEHTTHGHIEKWIDITLKGAGRLIDFGEGWTDFMYLAMSIAGIFLVAGCFGEIDVRLGAIFIPITGGIFWFIGWMSETYGVLIMTAGVLGVLYYMRSKAKELDT